MDSQLEPAGEPQELTEEEAAALQKILAMNSERATRHLSDLTAGWGLGGLHHELDELLKGMREADRPQVAVALVAALQTFLDAYGPTGVVGTADTYRDHA